MEDVESEYSLEILEACSYRFLQQTAKSMGLPSNVKKTYLIELIYTKKHCSDRELEDLVKRVRLERQQHTLLRKTPVKKRKKQTQQSSEISSTSTSHSPPISNTPKRVNQVFIRYSPNSVYKLPRATPSRTSALSSSDRVLRSFNRVKKPSYLLNSTLFDLINSSEEKSETRVNIVRKEKYQKINKTYVRKTNIRTENCMNRKLVPVARSASIMPSSAPVNHQRRLSGIYPLTTEDYRLTNVNVRRSDGSLCKINAIIQKRLTQQYYNYDGSPARGQSLLKLTAPALDEQPETATKSSQTVTSFTYRASNYRIPRLPKSTIISTFENRPNLPDVACNFGYRARNSPEVISAVGYRAQHLPDVTSAVGYRAQNSPDVTSAVSYRAQYSPDVTSGVRYRAQDSPDRKSAIGYRAQNSPDVTSAVGYMEQNSPDVTSAVGYMEQNSPEVTSAGGYREQNSPDVTSAGGYREQNSPDLTSAIDYRAQFSPDVASVYRALDLTDRTNNVSYRAQNLPEVTSTSYRSPNIAEVTPNNEETAPYFPEFGLNMGYRAPNNSLVDFPQSRYNYSSGSDDMNVLNEEQVQSLRCRETGGCVEENFHLPSINEVFSKFNNVYHRDVRQPIYVQVDSEPELAPDPLFIPEPRTQYQGGSTLEKFYNLKNVNQPLLQICTKNMRTVYCTPVMSSIMAQPSSTAVYNVNNAYSPVDFRRSSSSETEINTLTSQEQDENLGANITIPEMVEDALELISQDGDYMERMGMDIKMQCVLCDWAGPNLLFENHIRKDHTDDIIQCESGEWSSTYTLGDLAAQRGWVSRLLEHRGTLYVLSAQYHDPDCFMATLSTISEPESPKSASMTIYNKVTGEPLTWRGDVTPFPPIMPDSDPHFFRLPLSRIDLLPNSANLKLLNRELVVESPNKVVVGQPKLENIHISLMVKIFD